MGGMWLWLILIVVVIVAEGSKSLSQIRKRCSPSSKIRTSLPSRRMCRSVCGAFSMPFDDLAYN